MPRARTALLAVHLLAGIGWMGVDIALLVLLLTARTSNDTTLVVSGFTAIRMSVPVAVPPLSLAVLATGLLLGLGTRWGLLRYWWVLVFVGLVPAVNSIAVAATTGSAAAVRAKGGPLPTVLLFPPIVSFLLLGTATVLSLAKPWPRTCWGRERS